MLFERLYLVSEISVHESLVFKTLEPVIERR